MKKLSLTEEVYNYLANHGPSTDAQIAAALSAKSPSVRRARNLNDRIVLHGEIDGHKVWKASDVAVPKSLPKVVRAKPVVIPAAPVTAKSRKLDRRDAVEEHARTVKRQPVGLSRAARLARILVVKAKMDARAALLVDADVDDESDAA